MENEELINKISSKYILNAIFNYIKDKNFKDILFLYSKKFQNKLDIKLLRLKENYLKTINLDHYLYIDPRYFPFKTDYLTKEYNKFVIPYNIMIIKGFEIIISYTRKRLAEKRLIEKKLIRKNLRILYMRYLKIKK